MKHRHGVALFLFAIATAGLLGTFSLGVEGQTATAPVTEAPTGFDNQTNGFLGQPQFDAARLTFEERDQIADGLGPVYNAQGCVECHQNPVTGAVSQISELRAGHRDASGNFVDAPGGSLINDRTIDARFQETVPPRENVRTTRIAQNTLGDGFVEAIDDSALIAIANAQPGQSGGLIAGQVIEVDLPEAPGSTRVGRFGWKNQQASLLGFSGDAYLNEIGITNRLFPFENTSLGRSVASIDTVPDPEDVENDIVVFADFMRSTKAPPRDAALAATTNAVAGSSLFDNIGCSICHVRSITTAAPGTRINGGTLVVPSALGNKVIHPFGDFLLHDIGTGDGIAQTQHADLPPRGFENREKIPDDIKAREGIVQSKPILKGASSGSSRTNRVVSNSEPSIYNRHPFPKNLLARQSDGKRP